MQEMEIGAIAGTIVSLIFKYVPGANTWFEKLLPEHKQLFMLGMLVVVVAGGFALSCAGWESFYACDQLGAKEAIYALVGAIIGNQSTYKMLSYQKQ